MKDKLLMAVGFALCLCLSAFKLEAQPVSHTSSLWAMNELGMSGENKPESNNNTADDVSVSIANDEKQESNLRVSDFGSENLTKRLPPSFLVPVHKTKDKEIGLKPFLLQETVTGSVTDAQTGDPVIGANILVVGTASGAATNVNGEFSVTVASLQDTLRITSIGYQTTLVPINGRNNLNISLNPDIAGLDQLVVIGFGEQSRRNIVGNVSSVDMNTFNNIQSTTFDQKLQGKISGVTVSTTSGRIGAPVKINVRGTSSVNASSQPLYVVDGIPVVNESLGSGTPTYGDNGEVNPFINLESDNIKSIEVLKGASAAAIYGTRGSNGVILITTKSGTAGAQNLDINISGGVTTPSKYLDVLDTRQYIEIYNYKNGTNFNPADYPDTDWQRAVTRTGSFQKYGVSMSGGSENTTYFLSGNYRNELGMILGNDLQLYDAQVKVNQKFNEKLNVELSVNPSVTTTEQFENFGQVGAPFGFGVLNSPAVPVFKPDGTVNDGRDSSVPGNQFNPFPGTPYTNALYMNMVSSTRQALTQASATYKIQPNLTFVTRFGYQFLDNIVDTYYRDNTVNGYPGGVVGANTHAFTNSSWSNTINYKNDWGKNSLEVTLGATFEKTNNKNFGLIARDIPSYSLKDINSAGEIVDGIGNNTSYAFQNNVARISYIYNEKYLLTLTGSYDGTSRFADGHRYGFFPSIAAGWIISDEDFAQNIPALSFLKLQASFGVSGNANIGNFDYQALLDASQSYNSSPAFTFSQLANLGLTWETGNEIDFGLQFGFFNDRLSGKIDYFDKLTTNLLLRQRVSNINGFTTLLVNGGKLRNNGIELNFDAYIVQNRDFQWLLSANVSAIKNKIVDLPGGQIIGARSIVMEGEPIASFYVPKYMGVDPANGDALYDDGNGGVTANYSAAARYLAGSPHPKHFGGFGTSASYKNFDMSVDFSYTYGNKVYWTGGEYLVGGRSVYNQSVLALDYWTPAHTNGTTPEPRLTANGSNISTRYIEDGSYLRLRSVQLGYNIRSNFLGAKSIRVYVNGTNLLTLTKFSGLDPEGTTGYTSNTALGMINNNDPQPVAFTGGIQIKM